MVVVLKALLRLPVVLKAPLRLPRHWWEDNSKMDLRDGTRPVFWCTRECWDDLDQVCNWQRSMELS
jgi:hypothetical protein